MSKPIIEVDNLSKRYRIGANKEPYLSLRDEMATTARRASSAFLGMFSRNHQPAYSSETDFWALRDVSFSVQEGQTVGIIGRNGAGKSTLLKLLTKITPPTKGHITMRGRVASLLEVGTGFHPELTGRENIFLNGAILGMSREEIRRKFDEIVAFSEVEKFLDTPVKRYSSGMYVRLAFAVAAHLEPEILVVDEVLAVGDIEFQKKCLGKMGEVAKGGRTVLFVSHNMSAVKALCTVGVFLAKGAVESVGDMESVIGKYLKHTITSVHVPLSERRRDAEQTLKAKIIGITVVNDAGADQTKLHTNRPFTVKLLVEAKMNMRCGAFVHVKDELQRIIWCESAASKVFYFLSPGLTEIMCEVSAPFLSTGEYYLDCGLSIPNQESIDYVTEAYPFEIIGSDVKEICFEYTKKHGVYSIEHNWK